MNPACSLLFQRIQEEGNAESLSVGQEAMRCSFVKGSPAQKLRRVNLECPRLTPAQWENVLRSIPYEEEWMDWPVAYGVA